MGQISRGLLNVHSVAGARPSLSSCPRSTRCHGEQDRPALALLKLRVHFSQQHGLANTLSLGSLQCSSGLMLPPWVVVSHMSVCLVQCWPPEATPGQCVTASSRNDPKSGALATVLRMVQKHEAKVSWRNYSLDLNSSLRFLINQFVSVFYGSPRHHHVEIHTITPENSAGGQ